MRLKKKKFLNFFLLENQFCVMTICRTAYKQHSQVPAPLFTAASRVLNSTELGVPPSNIFSHHYWCHLVNTILWFTLTNVLVFCFLTEANSLISLGKKKKASRVFYTICSAPNSINVKTVTMSWKIWQHSVCYAMQWAVLQLLHNRTQATTQ